MVGDVPNTKWSPIDWFLKLQLFQGPRPDKRGPMFVDPDMRRPLLYRKLREQFRELQVRVGVPEDELTGPHGLRVEGYNGVKNGLGAELAQAHGLWKSAAHKRHERFRMMSLDQHFESYTDSRKSASRSLDKWSELTLSCVEIHCQSITKR